MSRRLGRGVVNAMMDTDRLRLTTSRVFALAGAVPGVVALLLNARPNRSDGAGPHNRATPVPAAKDHLAGQLSSAAAATARTGSMLGCRNTDEQAARSAGREEGSAMHERATDTVQNVRDQATHLVHNIAEQTAARAGAGAERAREVGSTIASSARERMPHVSHRVGDDVVPSLRDLANQAATAALDLWQTAREKASDAAGAAQSDLPASAAHIVDAAEKRAREATAHVTERAEAVGERAKQASAHAAEATVATGKDTGALLFWAGAAAGIIFYALLSKERRDQVLTTAKAIFSQGRELIRDFQGYDEEFT